MTRLLAASSAETASQNRRQDPLPPMPLPLSPEQVQEFRRLSLSGCRRLKAQFLGSLIVGLCNGVPKGSCWVPQGWRQLTPTPFLSLPPSLPPPSSSCLPPLPFTPSQPRSSLGFTEAHSLHVRPAASSSRVPAPNQTVQQEIVSSQLLALVACLSVTQSVHLALTPAQRCALTVPKQRP